MSKSKRVLVYLAGLSVSLLVVGVTLVLLNDILDLSLAELIFVLLVLVPAVAIGSYLGVRIWQQENKGWRPNNRK